MSLHMRVIASLVGLMALATWAAEPSLAQVAIGGRVLDDESGRPLVGARVLLLNRYQKVVGYSVTDDTGHFAFKPRHGSRMRLEARAVGYRPTVTPVLWMVGDREFASLEIRLAPNVVLLAPVEIVAMSLPTTSPVLENVMQRRSSGFGIQITRQDIQQRRPQQLSDMLIELPGVYARGTRGSGTGGRSIYMARAVSGAGGAACPVQVFLDGMRATREGPGGDVQVDDLVSPLDVEVVEVFRGMASIPPEFVTDYARCGVIAIWTRRALEPPS